MFDKEELKQKYSTTFEDSFSEEVWKTTYKHNTDENVNDTLFRVAGAIASVEETEELKKEWTEKFYEMLSGFSVVPGGRILSNAGTGWEGTTLVNCFVGPKKEENIDSLQGIMKDLENQAQTLKSEGGWGFNFCLEFSTPILTRREGREELLPIENVRIGDYVLSSDSEFHLVEETLTSIKNNMVELIFDTGTSIKCTDDHPFLVVRDGIEQWILAGDILETDDIVTV